MTVPRSALGEVHRPEWETEGEWIHWDQNPWEEPHFERVHGAWAAQREKRANERSLTRVPTIIGHSLTRFVTPPRIHFTRRRRIPARPHLYAAPCCLAEPPGNLVEFLW